MRYRINSNGGEGSDCTEFCGVYDTCGMNGGLEVEAIVTALNKQWADQGYAFDYAAV